MVVPLRPGLIFFPGSNAPKLFESLESVVDGRHVPHRRHGVHPLEDLLEHAFFSQGIEHVQHKHIARAKPCDQLVRRFHFPFRRRNQRERFNTIRELLAQPF